MYCEVRYTKDNKIGRTRMRWEKQVAAKNRNNGIR